MKFRTKLVVSFCIILFVPILLSVIAFSSVQAMQARRIEQAYGIENGRDYVWSDNWAIISSATKEDVDKLINTISRDPYILADEESCQFIDTMLQEKSAYLVVRVGDEITYFGNAEALDLGLPEFSGRWNKIVVGNSISSDSKYFVQKLDFYFPDGSEGSVFIVAELTGVLPEMERLLFQIAVAICMILLFTAIMLIAWISRSLGTPIRKLQVAAENIKNGNLDFTVEVNSKDELGQLCQSFEEMRIRLKDNAAEKIEDEKENRALISNIAHDLKTPITAVKGYAEGILDGVANTPEKIEKYVKTIYNKANEMDTLINELTLYSKIDTNRIPYNFAKINVMDYFNDCVEEIGLDLEEKSIDLTYYNEVESDVLIIADPEQLRRVVSNIVGNSVKYKNKTHSTIAIRIKDVGDFIQVEIEDNGRGIATRDLPYIFDRFYRADASRNSATGGSGIGLSIVKKIIEDHGGKIWATSKEDVGTVMYFVIRKYQEAIREDDVVVEA